MRFARSILAFSAMAWLMTVSASADQAAPTTGRSIASLAHIPLMSRQGAAVQLGSRVASGKPTLIAVWASWCPPCVAEAPYLDKARKDLGKSYNFLYINRREGNPDPDQPADQVAQFLDRAGLSDVDYLVADVRAYQQIVGADFKDIPQGKVGIPRLYLFDAEGRQVYTSYGFDEAEGAQLEQRIKRAMTK